MDWRSLAGAPCSFEPGTGRTIHPASHALSRYKSARSRQFCESYRFCLRICLFGPSAPARSHCSWCGRSSRNPAACWPRSDHARARSRPRAARGRPGGPRSRHAGYRRLRTAVWGQACMIRRLCRISRQNSHAAAGLASKSRAIVIGNGVGRSDHPRGNNAGATGHDGDPAATPRLAQDRIGHVARIAPRNPGRGRGQNQQRGDGGELARPAPGDHGGASVQAGADVCVRFIRPVMNQITFDPIF